MHFLSVLMGLVFAWVILFFIGPKKCISYYVQAPVVGAPIAPTEIDKMLEAVGLSQTAPSPETSAPAPVSMPIPEPSVADVAMQTPAAVPEMPQMLVPAPAPSPMLV